MYRPAHRFGPANIHGGTFFKPCEYVTGTLPQTVLDVYLAFLVAGEGDVESGEAPISEPAQPLSLL